MKVMVTVDYWDGRESKTSKKPVPLETLDTTFMKMQLAHQGVAGLTITRLDSLVKMTKDLD